jgi:hypothetical protein
VAPAQEPVPEPAPLIQFGFEGTAVDAAAGGHWTPAHAPGAPVDPASDADTDSMTDDDEVAAIMAIAVSPPEVPAAFRPTAHRPVSAGCRRLSAFAAAAEETRLSIEQEARRRRIQLRLAPAYRVHTPPAASGLPGLPLEWLQTERRDLPLLSTTETYRFHGPRAHNSVARDTYTENPGMVENSRTEDYRVIMMQSCAGGFGHQPVLRKQAGLRAPIAGGVLKAHLAYPTSAAGQQLLRSMELLALGPDIDGSYEDECPRLALKERGPNRGARKRIATVPGRYWPAGLQMHPAPPGPPRRSLSAEPKPRSKRSLADIRRQLDTALAAAPPAPTPAPAGARMVSVLQPTHNPSRARASADDLPAARVDQLFPQGNWMDLTSSSGPAPAPDSASAQHRLGEARALQQALQHAHHHQAGRAETVAPLRESLAEYALRTPPPESLRLPFASPAKPRYYMVRHSDPNRSIGSHEQLPPGYQLLADPAAHINAEAHADQPAAPAPPGQPLTPLAPPQPQPQEDPMHDAHFPYGGLFHNANFQLPPESRSAIAYSTPLPPTMLPLSLPPLMPPAAPAPQPPLDSAPAPQPDAQEEEEAPPPRRRPGRPLGSRKRRAPAPPPVPVVEEPEPEPEEPEDTRRRPGRPISTRGKARPKLMALQNRKSKEPTEEAPPPPPEPTPAPAPRGRPAGRGRGRGGARGGGRGAGRAVAEDAAPMNNAQEAPAAEPIAAAAAAPAARGRGGGRGNRGGRGGARAPAAPAEPAEPAQPQYTSTYAPIPSLVGPADAPDADADDDAMPAAPPDEASPSMASAESPDAASDPMDQLLPGFKNTLLYSHLEQVVAFQAKLRSCSFDYAMSITPAQRRLLDTLQRVFDVVRALAEAAKAQLERWNAREEPEGVRASIEEALQPPEESAQAKPASAPASDERPGSAAQASHSSCLPDGESRPVDVLYRVLLPRTRPDRVRAAPPPPRAAVVPMQLTTTTLHSAVQACSARAVPQANPSGLLFGDAPWRFPQSAPGTIAVLASHGGREVVVEGTPTQLIVSAHRFYADEAAPADGAAPADPAPEGEAAAIRDADDPAYVESLLMRIISETAQAEAQRHSELASLANLNDNEVLTALRRCRFLVRSALLRRVAARQELGDPRSLLSQRFTQLREELIGAAVVDAHLVTLAPSAPKEVLQNARQRMSGTEARAPGVHNMAHRVIDAFFQNASPIPVPVQRLPLANAPRANAPLANAPLDHVPLSNVFLGNAPLDDVPLGNAREEAAEEEEEEEEEPPAKRMRRATFIGGGGRFGQL